MFRSFVRMLGLTGETTRTSNTSVKGFSPRLETLDGRVMPSTLHVAAGIDTAPAMARSVETPAPPIWVGIGGGAAGGVVGSGHSSGGVELNGGMPGGVLGDRAGMVSLDGGSPGGVLGDRAGMVSLDGGASGGVIGDRAGIASVDTSLTLTRSAGEEIPQT